MFYVNVIITLIEKLKIAAGLEINWTKSVVYWFGKGDNLI